MQSNVRRYNSSPAYREAADEWINSRAIEIQEEAPGTTWAAAVKLAKREFFDADY
ncbi:hypothetical protein vBSlqSZDD2_20 [Serratia phage vB_SlqS_ZDD2]|nr:hypothetical protein vBSlqSZDD2_20 [Serratia phage vB_SlqS_ZDD2]